MKILQSYKQSIALVCALTFGGVANAAIVTNELTGEVFSGSFAGTIGFGTFSYDDGLITGMGEEVLLGNDFDLEFTIFDQTFTNADDIDFPDFPELRFVDGMAMSIDFVVEGLINEPGVFDFSFFDINEDFPGSFSTEVIVNSVQAVPVPAAVWLFGSGLIGLIGLARRKKVS